MLTRCPRCKTSFRVLAEHLRAARGRVQCGRCSIQFDALEYLFDDPAETRAPALGLDDAPAPASEARAAPDPIIGEGAPAPTLGAVPAVREEDGDGLARAVQRIERAFARREAGASASTPIDLNELIAGIEEQAPAPAGTSPPPGARIAGESRRPAAAGHPTLAEDGRPDIALGNLRIEPQTPSRREARPAEEDVLLDDVPRAVADRGDPEIYFDDSPTVLSQRQRRGSPFWGIAAALLLLLLPAQILWYERETLVKQVPELRSLIERLCKGRGCELKPEHDLATMKMLARDVREHPRFRDALLVNATLVNEAAFAQPFPIVELALYDRNGTMLAARRFQPAEYLDASIPQAAGMKPRQPVYIVLEVAGTGEEAASFEFKFL